MKGSEAQTDRPAMSVEDFKYQIKFSVPVNFTRTPPYLFLTLPQELNLDCFSGHFFFLIKGYVSLFKRVRIMNGGHKIAELQKQRLGFIWVLQRLTAVKTSRLCVEND